MIRTRYWLMALGLVCAGCLAALFLLEGSVRTGRTAHVLRDGVLLQVLELDEDTSITVTADDGGTNTIQVRDGAICVSHATCPDQVCVRRGWVRTTAAPIVCLPHGLVIELKDGEPNVDAHT